MENPFEQFKNPFLKFKQTQGPKVIATTKDGGEVFKLSDGSLAFKSPGYSTTDQEAIARIMEGATPKEEVQRGRDEQIISERPITGRAQEFAQGTPLVGEYIDEAVGMVAPETANRMRTVSDAFERQRPMQSAGLNIAGGITAAVPLAVAGGGSKAADFVGRGKTALGRGVRTAGVAGGAGAVEGAAVGSGRAEDGERLRGGAIGAGVGFGLGAVLGPFADMVGGGVSELAKRVKRLDVSTISDALGISAPAARTVKEALVNDDLNAAVSRLGQLGDDAMLADAGPATGALLDAASKTGGEALRTTREAVEGRAGEMGRRLPGQLDNILGSGGGVRAAARDISQRTAPARQAAYDRAYGTPIDYAGDAGRRIEATLERVPPKTLQAAVDEANEAMREAGTRNQQIMAKIADDGSVSFSQPLNVQQLDELKKALDGIGREAVDQFGRPTGQGVRAQRLARDLRTALGDAVPAYKAALRIGGDKIQEDQALDLGKKLLFRNTTVEDVRDFVSGGISDEARAALRRGMRETIEQNLSNVKRTITDPNNDAREAMQIVKELSSRANIAKVRMVLGKEKADALLNELDKQAAALALRGAVARNSDTAIRQAIQGQVTDEATPGLVRRTAGNLGNPLDAAQEVTQTIAGIDPRSMSEAQRQIFAEIARALTRIKGQDAQRALVAVRKALAGQPIKDAEAQLIGRAVASGTGLAAYRSGQRVLEGQ